MARRKTAYQIDEQWRQRIQVTKILERLQSHMLGDCEMTPTQVRAAEILLKKTIPDLSSTEFHGEVEHTGYVAQLPPVSPSVDEWHKQHVVQ